MDTYFTHVPTHFTALVILLNASASHSLSSCISKYLSVVSITSGALLATSVRSVVLLTEEYIACI